MKLSLIKLGASLLATGVVSAGTVIITSKVVEQHNYNLVHEINTTDVYKINGEEVSYEEWRSYLEDLENGITDTTSVSAAEEPNNKIKEITYADTAGYRSLMLTEGTEFECLAVYNASDRVAGGCSDSYVIGCCSDGYHVGISDKVKGDDYFNLSCVCRTADVNYESYKINCTNRTSPGDYNNQGGWSVQGNVPMGMYYLENAKVEIVNKSTTTYGSQYVYQIIISYDWAYSPTEYISHLQAA